MADEVIRGQTSGAVAHRRQASHLVQVGSCNLETGFKPLGSHYPRLRTKTVHNYDVTRIRTV